MYASRSRWPGLVAAVCMFSCLSGITSVALAQTAPLVRISAAEFVKDPHKVAAFAKAVASMREHDTAPATSREYRGSWNYWAATHGYFGSGPNSSGPAADFIASASSNCQGIAPPQYQACLGYYSHVQDLPVPADGIAPLVWGSCQHSDPEGGPTQANLHFLTWHRMYLHFLERVLRKNSGDANFTLPYWDYMGEVGPGGSGLALPRLVRGSLAPALSDPYRTVGLNDFTVAISPNPASAVQAFKFTDMPNFSFSLEMQPHGAMHCATGSGCRAPDMGIVPVAGLDPVFYMHHANIDRLWQCWMVRKANGQPITLEWAKKNLGMPDEWFAKTFDFADENGNKATMSVQQLFEPGFIDTKYDKESSCVPLIVSQVPNAAVLSLSSTNAVVLADKPASVRMRPAPRQLAAPQAQEAVKGLPGRTLLLLQDIKIVGNPASTYDIYVHENNKPDKAIYIATLNYFGVLGPTHGNHRHGKGVPGVKSVSLLYYDIGSELGRLGVSKSNTLDLAVRFVPTDGTLRPSVTARSGAASVTIRSIAIQTAK